MLQIKNSPNKKLVGFKLEERGIKDGKLEHKNIKLFFRKVYIYSI